MTDFNRSNWPPNPLDPNQPLSDVRDDNGDPVFPEDLEPIPPFEIPDEFTIVPIDATRTQVTYNDDRRNRCSTTYCHPYHVEDHVQNILGGLVNQG